MDWFLIVVGVVAGAALQLLYMAWLARHMFHNELAHQKWWKLARNVSVRAPAILIVDLLPGRNITVGAKTFIKGDLKLGSVNENRFFTSVRLRIE